MRSLRSLMKNAVSRSSILAMSVAFCVVTSSTSRPEIVSDFSGGMNTFDSWTLIQPNEGYRVMDLLLDSPRGALTPRFGYRAVTDSLGDYKKLWSVSGHRFTDGTSVLFGIAEADLELSTVTTCDLLVSSPNSYDLVDTLATDIYPDHAVWATWNDRQFFFNGHQPELYIDHPAGGFETFSMTARPYMVGMRYLIPPAPGQAVPVAYNDSTGGLDGEYRYAILTQVPCSSSASIPWSKRPGPISRPVTVHNEAVLITNFYQMIGDTLCELPDDTTQWFKILRTKANRTDIDFDSLWVVDSVQMGTITQPLVPLWFVDDKADDELGPLWGTIRDTDLTDPRAWWPRQGKNSAYAAGSMTYLTADTGEAGSFADPLFRRADTGDFYLLYFYALLDKATGVQSGPSEPLYVYFDSSGASGVDSNMTLGVPAPPSDQYHRIIYRGRYNYPDDGRQIKSGLPADPHDYVFVDNRDFAEFTGLAYYPVDTLTDPTQTAFYDTLSWTDVVLEREAFEDQAYDGRYFKGAIVHESRLFAWDDYGVYPSVTDTAGKFSALEELSFDLDDGDRIVGLASFDGFVVTYKTRSEWIIYTDDGSVYDRRRKNVGFGLTSYQALSSYKGSNIYLGLEGVTGGTSNQYRTNALQRDFLSNPIKNIMLRSADSMSNAAAIAYQNRWLLSYPGTDTSFVFFFDSGGWGLFSFDFQQAFLYDTLRASALTPFDQMCFIKPDDERIFVLDDTMYTNNGASYSPTWEKRYIGVTDLTNSLSRLVLWSTATVDTSVAVTVTVTNEDLDTLWTGAINDLAGVKNIERISALAGRTASWFNVSLSIPATAGLSINALQIDWTDGGEEE